MDAMLYRRLLPALVFAVMAGFAEPSLSAEFEAGPDTSASQILGKAAAGSNYEVGAVVASDGLLRTYTLNTPYGQFVVHGDAFLARRLKELAALAVLERESSSGAFKDAMARAIGAPIRTAGSLVTRPVKTIGRTVSGLGEMFSRVAAGAAHPGADPDGTANALLGISAAKRQIAAQLGVDPYTDFPPLASSLENMAKASALGGLTVKLALSAMPGTAGTAISSASTADSVQSLLKDKTPAQLVDYNTNNLKKLGVPAKSIRAFLDNRYFTLEDHTAIVSALAQLKGVKNPGAFIARASDIERRDLAVFLRRRAEMLAAYQQQTGASAAFILVRGFPMNQLKDGRVLFLVPIDSLAWTPEVAGAASAITNDLQKLKRPPPILAISGGATAAAVRGLQALGWEIKIGIGL